MRRAGLVVTLLALSACGGDSGGSGSVTTPAPTPSVSPTPSPSPSAPATPAPITAVSSTTIATFASPWAMTFLPDGRALVTEKGGTLRLVTAAGAVSSVSGVPAVVNAGQGGLADVAVDPNFASNRRVYLSYAEAGTGGAGLAVARGTLNAAATALENVAVIWRAAPKTGGSNHFSGRLLFSPDGTSLFVSAGERQQGTPAQDLSQTLGKIVRLTLDGAPAGGNPFATTAGARAEIWSYGHRNIYGLAYDASGRLWEHEMGPAGGDELNVIESGRNYGWPRVSNGQNYDGTNIPDHAPGDGFAAPALSWTPVIAPSGMIIYSGTLFAAWRGDAIISGLVSQGLVRVTLNGTAATEAQRIGLGTRIREVEQAPDGAIWVLEDGAGGRLRRLVPGS
jgi:aldose sugar dehydrogenase